MDKLKTLNDMTDRRFLCAKCFMEVEPPADDILYNQVNAIILKREAIKWVKLIESEELIDKSCEACKMFKTKMICRKEDSPIIFNENEQDALIDWIMYFFNITEEDLKC